MQKLKFLLSAVLLLPILFWIAFFYEQPFSHDPSDWGNFGSYFGGIITSISIPITLFYVLKTYLSQKELERVSKLSVIKSEFDNRWFELVRVFNDYRLTQLETWTQTQDKPETREYFKGLKWFLYHRRKYQQNFIDLVKHSGQDVAHNKAYELTIGHNELAFEYYFRSIETMIQTIETHHNSVVRLDPDNSDKENYIQLLCTLFTNDQLFFIKYCHDFHLFHDKFPLIRKHIELLTSGMFKDYRLSRD